MSEILKIVIPSLAGMALLLYVVAGVLRRNQQGQNDDIESIVAAELSRAKRFGKLVVLVLVELEQNSKVDFGKVLTGGNKILREYDAYAEIEPGKFIIMWPEDTDAHDSSYYQERARARMSGIEGVRGVRVALFPQHGNTFDALVSHATQL